MPAAPSTSATAAEWTVENFDCSPLDGSTTSVIDSTKGCTRSFISLHGFRGDAVAVAQRDHGIDERMEDDAAGIGLVAVGLDDPRRRRGRRSARRSARRRCRCGRSPCGPRRSPGCCRSRARRAAPRARRSPPPCRHGTICRRCRGSAACRRPGSRRCPWRRSGAGRRARSACRPRRPAAMLPSVPVRCQPPLWWPGAARPVRTPASKPTA